MPEDGCRSRLWSSRNLLPYRRVQRRRREDICGGLDERDSMLLHAHTGLKLRRITDSSAELSSLLLRQRTVSQTGQLSVGGLVAHDLVHRKRLRLRRILPGLR